MPPRRRIEGCQRHHEIGVTVKSGLGRWDVGAVEGRGLQYAISIIWTRGLQGAGGRVWGFGGKAGPSDALFVGASLADSTCQNVGPDRRGIYKETRNTSS